MSFFLFPGQGSQVPGMGKSFYDAGGAARAVLDEAALLAGPGFLERMFDDPDGELAQTLHAQPALLAVEVAIARHLATAGHAASGCAGHSLGEIPALVAAGALEFDAAMALTRERARLSVEDVPEGGMLAVIGLAADAVEAALPEGVDVANYNGPGQTIVSGTKAGIAAAETALKAAGAKRVLPLKVSGPFHSSCMAEAATRFQAVLSNVKIATPGIRFVSSVKGADVSDPEEIRALLGVQLCSPVRWTQVMTHIGPVRAFEVGPGRVLQGLAKRTDEAPKIELAGTLDAANALEIDE